MTNPHIEKVLQSADEYFKWRLSSKTSGRIDNTCLMDFKDFLHTALEEAYDAGREDYKELTKKI